MTSGETHGWEVLATLDTEDVCTRTGAVYDADSQSYRVSLCGHVVTASVPAREMKGETEDAELMVSRLGYFASLSILCHLAGARDIALSGDYVKLLDLAGNEAYSSGSHALPVNGLAAKFGSNKSGFLETYSRLGGEHADYGDAAVTIEVLRGISVLVILWEGDEEFPARADLLIDRMSGQQLALDVIWSVAMLVVLFGLKA